MTFRNWYNPFDRLSGPIAAFAGALGLLLCSWLCYLTGTHLSGFLNVNFASDSPWRYYLTESIAHLVFVSIFLAAAGHLFGKSRFRVVDLAGFVLLSRLPMLLTPMVRWIGNIRTFPLLSWATAVLAIIFLLSAIWAITLTYHGFRVACNMKGKSLTLSFIVALLLAEVATKLLIYLVNR